MGGAPEARLDVRVLGPLEALRDGQIVPLGGAKPRALLAALALDPGRVVSVDRLVENLWPGEPPDTAAHAVQVYVSQLRSALGSTAIARRGPGYAFEVDPECVDAHRFARLADDGRAALHVGDFTAAGAALRDALDLWRGPALADFLYEPFAQVDIARLEDLRIAALEDRIEADLAVGRHADLVAELESLVDAHPLRERPRAQLMLALYRSGRQADALAAYRRARDTLVEELGIEPGPALRELEAAILRQDETLLPDAAAVAPAMQFRRLVTILHADVESPALDAEAAAVEWRRSFRIVSAAVTRHGGTVEAAGDSAIAAFGFPVSHEDDALRAARTALDIREQGTSLDVRIGIETGEVVATPGESRGRFVAGEAVGIAARLAQAAELNEVVVGTRAGRLIDHAAVLEPVGDLQLKGRPEPVRAYRLLEIAATASAFERRLDAPFVGRKRELALLRQALDDAVAESSPRAVVVVGPAGVGKSRLARGAHRADEGRDGAGRDDVFRTATASRTGHCARCCSKSASATRCLSALDADTPPPAAELALAFRRFCEELARERPLILVFDDVHWGEPTFLDLVQYVAATSEGPMLIVCLAREELTEDPPALLESAEQIVLDALSVEETDALLEGLGGAVLETDQRDRVVDAAEGNPLFLEQLLALALEGVGDRTMPETVQALLAARLDRLGPGERAVLERGSVVGKEFTADDVAALLQPDVAHTATAHLDALSTRGFVRPRGERRFRVPARSRPGVGLPCCTQAAAGRTPRALRPPPRSGVSGPARSSTSSPGTTSSRRTVCARNFARRTSSPGKRDGGSVLQVRVR